jgi:competence protein ComEC
MRCVLLAFAAGIAIMQTRAVLPALFACAVLMAIALVLMVLLIRFPASSMPCAPSMLPWPQIRIALCMICAASIGFNWAAFCAYERLQERLQPEWEGRDITLIGTVADLPVSDIRGTRFLFAVERAIAHNGVMPSVPARLSLSWYAGRNGKVVPAIEPGARWQFTVRLTRPHGNANPDGYDYELRLLERGIGATGYVRVGAATPAYLLDAFVRSPSHLLQRTRAYLRRKILAALPPANAAHAGVIVALIIGEQRAIAKTDWEIFRRTGVNHLVAISGLHIMMVAGLFGRLTLALWRRSFWLPERFAMPLPLRLPAQKASMAVAILAAFGYVALAGFGIPAQRALSMLLMISIALWQGRISSPSHILCVALAAVLLLDPWALLGAGFHLSFAAVAIILYAGVGRTKQHAQKQDDGAQRKNITMRCRRFFSALSDGTRTQWAVSLGLLPLTMLLFAQYSLIGPFANALAIPVVTLLVVPLALLGVVLPAPLAGWLLNAAHDIFSLLFGWLGWLSELPAAVWQAPLPGWMLFLTALTGTLLLLAPRGWPLRWAGWFGWLPLLLNTPSHPADGALWVSAFDIGQGMALLVETSQHRLLYDTGPSYGASYGASDSAGNDAGARIILPYLHARGIRNLNALVVSHSDSDHAGGALSILRALPVATVYSSLPAGHRIIEAALEHRRCVSGQHWQWDGVSFEILHPAATHYSDNAADAADTSKATSTKHSPNAGSCVLKITAGKQSILLPGDIGTAQERALIDEFGATGLQATVLLAPHHGSKTSSSGAFLRAVNPALAIFQVGYRNRFHHPQAAVYRRYGELDIQRLRTDETGAITLQFGATVRYQAYRQQHARYWYLKTDMKQQE